MPDYASQVARQRDRITNMLDRGPTLGQVGGAMLGSVGWAVSLYAKPTLFLIVGPGAGLFALLVRSHWRDRIVTLAIVLTPAAAFLAYQRYAAYGMDSSLWTGRWMEIRPFWVWSQWTKSVPASILCTLAFPIAVTWLTRKDRARDDDMSFAWVLVLVGFVQAALMVEVDPEQGALRSANWFGGYLLATHLLFIVSTAAFFGWFSRLDGAARRESGLCMAWELLVLEAISGIVYLIRLNVVISSFA